jgi:L-ascorbate metabolism protein UlaG (beta-lactamase superfamily)
MVGTDRVIGMHYNTFPIIEIDEGLAKTTFETAGIDLILLEIGKSLEL